MKQIVTICSEGVDTESAVSNWITKLTKVDSCIGLLEDIQTKWFTACNDFTHISPDKSKEEWTTLATPIPATKSPEETRNSGREDGVVVSLDSALHDLADSLPYFNSMVYIFVFLQHDDLRTNDSFIPLAGALKRLHQWHNASIIVVQLDSSLSTLAQSLADFVRCRCQKLEEPPSVMWPAWIGKMVLFDHKRDRGLVYPQFTLHCNQWDVFLQQKIPKRVMPKPVTRSRKPLKEAANTYPSLSVGGHQIEILQEIDLSTFPIFMLSPWTLQLQSSHPESQTMMSFVRNMNRTGLIARMKIHFNLPSIPRCGDIKALCTSAWKEYIITSPKKIADPPEEWITSCTQVVHLLILPDLSVAPKSDTTSPLLAKFLLGSAEISPSIINALDDRLLNHYRDKNAEKKDVDKPDVSHDYLSLPVVKTEHFCHVMRLYRQQQALAIKEWQDGQINLSEEGFHQLMTDFDQYIIKVLMKDARKQEVPPGLNNPATKRPLVWTYERASPLIPCPERIAFQLLHGKASQSGKSTPSSSLTPLSARKQQEKNASKDFHIEDILNTFDRDGTLKLKKALAPLGSKGKSLCRVPSQPDLSSKWPDNQFLHYHDIFYYNSEEDLSFEKKFVNLRDRGSFDDTRSSFVTPRKKPPGRPMACMSPVRSSPRGKTSQAGHSLSRAHSQSLNSLSPMKRFKTSTGPFKYPSSQAPRKSPRKRPASTLTPDSAPPPPKATRLHKLGSLSDLNTPVRRSPRKLSATSLTTPSPSSNPAVKRLSLTPVSEKSLRRSPRKKPSSSRSQSSWEVDGPSNERSSSQSSSQTDLDSSLNNSGCQDFGPKDAKAQKMKRSERHKMRLQSIIATVLKDKDVKKGDTIYSSCFRNLFNVSLVLLKALPNSRNLIEEMKSVVYGQVQQIINLEKRRSGIAL